MKEFINECLLFKTKDTVIIFVSTMLWICIIWLVVLTIYAVNVW